MCNGLKFNNKSPSSSCSATRSLRQSVMCAPIRVGIWLHLRLRTGIYYINGRENGRGHSQIPCTNTSKVIIMNKMRDLTDLSQWKGCSRRRRTSQPAPQPSPVVKRSSHKTHMQLPFVAVLCVKGIVPKDILRMEGPVIFYTLSKLGEWEMLQQVGHLFLWFFIEV